MRQPIALIDGGVLFALLTLLCGVFHVSAQDTAKEDSTAFWNRYQPGSNTLALYAFDAPDAFADLSGKSSRLSAVQGAESASEGRFGGGLKLAAGHAPLALILGEGLFQQGRFIIDFWFRADALPSQGGRYSLLFKPHAPGKANGLNLFLTDDGALGWTHRTLTSSDQSHPEWWVEMRTPAHTIRARRWHHVAVYVGSYAHVFGSDIAYLAVDGKTVDEEPHGWRYIDYSTKESGNTTLTLGGSADPGESFVGTIDQFRVVSGLFRKFFPAPDESWLDLNLQRALPASTEFVASPEAILLRASFEDTVTAEIARGSAKPVRALGQPDFAPGVRGKALKTSGGWIPLAYAAKDNLNPSLGAVEMWVKPLGWQHLGTRLQWFLHTDNGGPTFYIPNDGFAVQVSGGMENHGVDYRPDTWMHFVLVWADRKIVLYVNGEKKLEGMMPKPFDPQKDYHTVAPPFGKEMLVDEFTIYRRPLSAAEARNHYRRFFPQPQLTRLGSVEHETTFLQGVGKVIGVAYPRLPLTAVSDSWLVTLQQGAKTLATATVPFTPEGGAPFLLQKLPVPLPNGDYRLRVEQRTAGKVSLLADTPFSFKRYPWLRNTIGITDRVLKPWTPIQVRNAGAADLDVGCWGRNHKVNAAGLFAQVTNQGREMLSAPMRLEAETAGKVVIAGGGALKVTLRKENEVHWTSTTTASVGDDPLQVTTDGHIEYDGHTVFNFRFSPTKNAPVRINRLSLVVPLKEELVEMYLCIFGIGLPHGMGAPPHYGHLSKDAGTIFSSKVWYEYTGWDGQMQHTGVFDYRQAVNVQEKKAKLERRWKPTLGNFVPQIWIGTYDRGISYMADSDQGWFPSDDAPAMVLERVGETVEWRFNFIAIPTELRGSRAITLSFQATPEKPQPTNWRKHFWRGPERRDGGIFCKWLGDSAGWDEEGVGPYRYDPDGSKKATDQMHAEGYKVTPHLDTSGFNWGAKTASEFAAEWDSGGLQYNMLFTRSKVDYAVWSHERWKDQYGVDGVYFDTGTPLPNYNTLSGTAYLLPDGRVQPGWMLFGQREYYKRSAHVFGDIGTQGFNWSCGYTGSQIGGWQFAAVPGGEYRIDYAMDRYPGPFDFMETVSNAGMHGTIMMWMGLSEYVKRSESPDNYRKFMRHMYAMMLVRDSKWCFGGFLYTNCFYDLSIADPDVRFVGYWHNPDVTFLSPAEGIKTSLYVKPNGRAIVVIANLADTPNQLEFRLDAKALTLDATRAQVLDGERSELNPKPNEQPYEWDRRINRGGVALMPGGDETLRSIEAKSDGDALRVKLLVPAHDFRLMEVIP